MLVNSKSKPVANPLRFDPSRTTALRRAFGADMLRRISALKSAIYQLIVVEDAFGHRPPQRFTVNTRFKFLTDDEKLKAFNRWFENEVKRGVLQVDHQGKPWTAKYVDSAYRKGRINAYLQAHREEYEKGTDWLLGGREQFLRSAFMQPETVQTLRLLGTRNFEQLKGITAEMSSQLSRILASGIAAGRAPQVIAREINKSIDGINKRRARLLASTELAYAQSEGQLDSFEDLGVKEVGIKAEWTTAGDNRVCERCNALSGMVFKIKQARGLIPLHPLCRCAWSPVYDVKASKLRRRQIKALGGPLPSPRMAAVQDADQKISRVEAQLDATYGVKAKLPRERPSKAVDYARLVEQEMAKIERRLPKVVQAKQPLELKLSLPPVHETPKETGEAFRKEVARQIWDQRLTEPQKAEIRELLRSEEINKRVLGTARSPKAKWQALFAAYTAKEALQKLLPEAFVELVKQWFE